MRNRSLSILLVLAGLTIAYTACKKIDTTEVGGDLIPAVDNVNTFDTVMDVITNNVLLDDSTRVLRGEEHALGVIANDPDFGKTKAEMYFLLSPEGYGSHPFAKKDSTIIFDSVVLAVAYTRIYGDTNSIQKVNVFEIDYDANFSHNPFGYRVDTADIPYDLTLLGTKVVNFNNLNDSVYDRRKRDTLRLVNQLRIPLNKTLGNRFLGYDTSSAYKNDSLFRTRFRGFALKIDEAGSAARNGLAYFNLNNANTKLIFYYRALSGTRVVDTLTAEFGFYTFNASNANLIRRTPSNGYGTALGNGTPNDAQIFLQASPGSMATIQIPNLRTLSNRIIHRAELIFEIENNIPEPIYAKPGTLFLDVNDTANKRILGVPYDFSYENNFQVLLGGLPSNNRYTFSITRYVQSVITRGEKDYSFRLSAPYRTNASELRSGGTVTPTPPEAKSGFPINSPIGAGRVVLTGGAHPNPARKARLRIVYSKI